MFQKIKDAIFRENKRLNKIITSQTKQIEEQTKQLNHCKPFLRSLSILGKPNSVYEYQVLTIEETDMKLEERGDCYIVLRKDENNDSETGVYKFTLALCDIRFNKIVSKINVETYFPEWKSRRVVRVLWIETEKEHREKGFAKFLINNLISYARNNRHEKIHGRIDIIDADSKKLVEFYKNMGFQVTKSGQTFYLVFPIF